MQTLTSALSNVGKPILPQHLLLPADCLSATGTLNVEKGLLSKEIAHLYLHPSCKHALLAAKRGVVDDLLGSVNELSWGKSPSRTGRTFDIIYSEKKNFCFVRFLSSLSAHISSISFGECEEVAPLMSFFCTRTRI
ncbi:hypothetical protein Vadar_032156 [Vaccinium darrowii]|uniref:Uncharacterized protein n=1 Tax=Vaccinium darrowii TaxID=229202 RepID=A0ACB7YBG5_9ERIC|nr:hypothetical protein Vadar_032156 [Vaccinium darrowii]